MILFTIGYEGRSPEEFFRLLQEHAVELLVDVRDNPHSRKPGFSRKALTASCPEHGIGYRHLPELGVPKALRPRIEDYDSFREQYLKLLESREQPLNILLELIAAQRACLLCYERDHDACHRALVAELALAQLGDALAVHHL